MQEVYSDNAYIQLARARIFGGWFSLCHQYLDPLFEFYSHLALISFLDAINAAKTSHHALILCSIFPLPALLLHLIFLI